MNTINTPIDENLIPVEIKPEELSIKEVFIDGLLSEKFIYKDSQWSNNVCLFKNCKNIPCENLLCNEHKINYKPDTIYYKGTKKYKKVNNIWVSICSHSFCSNKSLIKSTFCKYHKNHVNDAYSSNYNFGLIYNLIKEMK